MSYTSKQDIYNDDGNKEHQFNLTFKVEVYFIQLATLSHLW